jgi:hypothetical protein
MRITHNDLARTLGRIEGMLQGFETLPQRVAELEKSQSWNKGVWVALFGMFGWVLRLTYGR